jgi:hypothetical protein
MYIGQFTGTCETGIHGVTGGGAVFGLDIQAIDDAIGARLGVVRTDEPSVLSLGYINQVIRALGREPMALPGAQ